MVVAYRISLSNCIPIVYRHRWITDILQEQYECPPKEVLAADLDRGFKFKTLEPPSKGWTIPCVAVVTSVRMIPENQSSKEKRCQQLIKTASTYSAIAIIL